ncbi:MAG: DUF3465 domain-containing protein [Pseudomonadales bacterium]
MPNRKIVALAVVGVLALGAQLFPKQFAALQGLLETTPQAADQASTHKAAADAADVAQRGAAQAADNYARLERAIAQQEFEVWLDELDFEVVRVMRDDLEGSRHQRFLVSAADLPTILVAHNIDLAPRVPLQEGDRVFVRGRYEWNNKGGVIHWTHHDPKGRREGGWITHRGKVYK